MQSRRKFRAPMIAALLAFCLALTSCGLFGSPPAASDAVVGDNGADLTVAGVKIVVPAGAAPVGTKVNAAFEDSSPRGAEGAKLKTLAKAFKITLGDGLQPSKPLTVTVPVDKSLLIGEQSADTPRTIAMMIQSEGASKPDLVQGTWDPVAGTVTAEILHLSWVWPVQLDLPGLMRNVRDTVMQGMGIEYPKPDCADKPVTINGSTYRPISPAQAWLCVGSTNGALTVTASPNSPIPFLLTANPPSSATNKTEVSAVTAFSVALGHSLGFTRGSQSIMMPGADAQFTFTGAPAEVTVGFSQFPPMLLVSILAETLDIAFGDFGDAVQLDKVASAGCMQNILDTSQAGSALSPAVAAGIVKSFYGCVGSVLKLSLAQKIVLGILNAGPQFLVASALGIINEFTGGGIFSSTITASAPAVRGVMDGATRFVTMDPWNDGTLAKVVSTTDASASGKTAAEAYCQGSEQMLRKDAFRCYWPGIGDPCFQSPQSKGDFLCTTVDGQGKMIATRLKGMTIGDPWSGAHPNAGEPGTSSPVMVTLSDGTTCNKHSGAGPAGVPGYPYWVGTCQGPSGGIWRVGEPDGWKNDQQHYALYPSVKPGGYWQVAISVGAETTPAQRFDVVAAYR